MPRGAKPGERRGGRVKGTPNKLTAKLTASVQETLERLGCNPIEGMAIIAVDPNASLELRGRMNAELAQYLYPKRKAIEHSTAPGSPLEVNATIKDEFTSRIISIASRLRETSAH